MARRPEHSAYSTPDGSPVPAYRLPAYGSPGTAPSLPVREPGSAPPPAMRLPGVDDRLAIPEAGEEYIDGVRYEVMAAEPEHADPQCQLAHVVWACVAEGYVASTELLTRADHGSDFATDVCVRRAGTDPQTGQRYLEELSFEVANSQTLPELDRRAKKLVTRGVRRVFGLLVREEKVYEWTRSGGRRVRSLEGTIRDRALHTPLRIRAILDAAEAKRLVFEAMVSEDDPNLGRYVKKREAKSRAEGRREGRAEGRKEGRAENLRGNVKDLCGALGIGWSAERNASVEAMSLSELEALWEHLVNQKSWPEAGRGRLQELQGGRDDDQ